MPPLSFLSSSDEVWVFATSPEWCVLASLCPSSDNGNAGGRGNRKSSWPGKGLAGLWFCLLLEQPQGFSFIATSGTRTKNSDKKKITPLKWILFYGLGFHFSLLPLAFLPGSSDRLNIFYFSTISSFLFVQEIQIYPLSPFLAFLSLLNLPHLGWFLRIDCLLLYEFHLTQCAEEKSYLVVPWIWKHTG